MVVALLNAFNLILLYFAVKLAKKGQFESHKKMVTLCMLVSFVLVYLFLEPRIQNPDAVVARNFDPNASWGFKILIVTHIFAAMSTFFLSILTYTIAWFEFLRLKYHKKIARVLVPIWYYSSITGIILYLMKT